LLQPIEAATDVIWITAPTINLDLFSIIVTTRTSVYSVLMKDSSRRGRYRSQLKSHHNGELRHENDSPHAFDGRVGT
jgi:hypothetical protein